MGTTTAGLPYPESTDDLREGAGAIQALAEALDPTVEEEMWTSLAGALISPATGGGLEVRRIGRTVEVVGNVSGSFVDASATNILPVGAIPEDMRPNDPNGRLRCNIAYATSGYLCGALVRADGSVAYWMRGAPSARSSIQFSITFTRDEEPL